MSKLFEAIKAGNLKELKKLKEEGENLNEQDKDGNTALLWAACYGRLEIICWLLKESGVVQITEVNKVGNTALLLAAAFGHLDCVKWLLNEGNAQLTDKNHLGNTPLLMALCHDQLEIVDYLIRYYYIFSEFDEEEKLIIDSYSRNNGIDYYLQIVKLGLSF